MNAYRKNLVRKVYRSLDKDGNGRLEIDDIRDVFNAKKHPDVIARKKTEEEVLTEFLDTFEQHFSQIVCIYLLVDQKAGGRDHSVTMQEFIEYYNNISMSIDDDKYFELMLNNSWNVAAKAEQKRTWMSKY